MPKAEEAITLLTKKEQIMAMIPATKKAGHIRLEK
jgi:hypothetical protein